MANELAGVPETWFKSFVNAAERIPQGSIAREYLVAPHVFRSLHSEEVSWGQIQTLDLNQAQIDEFTNRANLLHAQNNIKHIVHPTSAVRDWNLTREAMVDLGMELNKWHQTENKLNPQIPFTTRLGILIDLAETGVNAFDLPDSRAAISWHMFLTKTDASYRRQLGAQPALIDLYKNVGEMVTKRATTIHRETGECVPTGIINLFNQRP